MARLTPEERRERDLAKLNHAATNLMKQLAVQDAVDTVIEEKYEDAPMTAPAVWHAHKPR